MKKFFNTLVVAASLLLCSAVATAQEAVPKHLELAREIVANVKSENNKYSIPNPYIKTPSDLFSSGYEVHTDCIGFVSDVIRRSGITSTPRTQKFKNRYSILDYLDSIKSGYMWDKVANINDLKPGDVLIWGYLKADSRHLGNGHTVFVDSAPVQIAKSYVPGLVQWEFNLLDSNPGATSSDDTRYVKGANAKKSDSGVGPLNGAGRGRMRLFTDANGVVKGGGHAFKKSEVFYVGEDWDLVMARPTAAK